MNTSVAKKSRKYTLVFRLQICTELSLLALAVDWKRNEKSTNLLTMAFNPPDFVALSNKSRHELNPPHWRLLCFDLSVSAMGGHTDHRFRALDIASEFRLHPHPSSVARRRGWIRRATVAGGDVIAATSPRPKTVLCTSVVWLYLLPALRRSSYQL